MAWEKRNNNKYYYRKFRDGDKVSTVYFGKDILAYKLSGEIHKQKLQKQKQQTQINSETAIDRALENNHQLIIAIAESAMLLSGYHLHKGSWRKRRG